MKLGMHVGFGAPPFEEQVAKVRPAGELGCHPVWAALIGPPDRVKERYAPWRDSGVTGLTLRRTGEEGLALMAVIVRAYWAG